MVEKEKKANKDETEKLWSQYGRLQAERERLDTIFRNKTQQMRQIQNQIAKLGGE